MFISLSYFELCNSLTCFLGSSVSSSYISHCIHMWDCIPKTPKVWSSVDHQIETGICLDCCCCLRRALVCSLGWLETLDLLASTSALGCQPVHIVLYLYATDRTGGSEMLCCLRSWLSIQRQILSVQNVCKGVKTNPSGLCPFPGKENKGVKPEALPLSHQL